MSAQNPPPTGRELDDAGRAADHVLALTIAQNPAYRVTPEAHDAMVALVQSVAALVGGTR